MQQMESPEKLASSGEQEQPSGLQNRRRMALCTSSEDLHVLSTRDALRACLGLPIMNKFTVAGASTLLWLAFTVACVAAAVTNERNRSKHCEQNYWRQECRLKRGSKKHYRQFLAVRRTPL